MVENLLDILQKEQNQQKGKEFLDDVKVFTREERTEVGLLTEKQIQESPEIQRALIWEIGSFLLRANVNPGLANVKKDIKPLMEKTPFGQNEQKYMEEFIRQFISFLENKNIHPTTMHTSQTMNTVRNLGIHGTDLAKGIQKYLGFPNPDGIIGQKTLTKLFEKIYTPDQIKQAKENALFQNTSLSEEEKKQTEAEYKNILETYGNNLDDIQIKIQLLGIFEKNPFLMKSYAEKNGISEEEIGELETYLDNHVKLTEAQKKKMIMNCVLLLSAWQDRGDINMKDVTMRIGMSEKFSFTITEAKILQETRNEIANFYTSDDGKKLRSIYQQIKDNGSDIDIGLLIETFKKNKNKDVNEILELSIISYIEQQEKFLEQEIKKEEKEMVEILGNHRISIDEKNKKELQDLGIEPDKIRGISYKKIIETLRKEREKKQNANENEIQTIEKKIAKLESLKEQIEQQALQGNKLSQKEKNKVIKSRENLVRLKKKKEFLKKQKVKILQETKEQKKIEEKKYAEKNLKNTISITNNNTILQKTYQDIKKNKSIQEYLQQEDMEVYGKITIDEQMKKNILSWENAQTESLKGENMQGKHIDKQEQDDSNKEQEQKSIRNFEKITTQTVKEAYIINVLKTLYETCNIKISTDETKKELLEQIKNKEDKVENNVLTIKGTNEETGTSIELSFDIKSGTLRIPSPCTYNSHTQTFGKGTKEFQFPTIGEYVTTELNHDVQNTVASSKSLEEYQQKLATTSLSKLQEKFEKKYHEIKDVSGSFIKENIMRGCIARLDPDLDPNSSKQHGANGISLEKDPEKFKKMTILYNTIRVNRKNSQKQNQFLDNLLLLEEIVKDAKKEDKKDSFISEIAHDLDESQYAIDLSEKALDKIINEVGLDSTNPTHPTLNIDKMTKLLRQWKINHQNAKKQQEQTNQQQEYNAKSKETNNNLN